MEYDEDTNGAQARAARAAHSLQAAARRRAARGGNGGRGNEAARRGPPRPTGVTLGDCIPRSLGMPPPAARGATAHVHTAADLIEFFLEYIQEEALGQISNAWLKTADHSRHMWAISPARLAAAAGEYTPPSHPDNEGIFNRRCLHLAALASKAVDYQKNGTAVTLPRELRASKVPHYMDNGKPGQDTYHSKTELGYLYDLAKRAEQGLGGGGGGGGGSGGAIYDGRLFVCGCATHVAEAASALAVYRMELTQVRAQCNVMPG